MRGRDEVRSVVDRAPDEPTWAELARTALSGARVATLRTGDRGATPTSTTVTVEDAGDGRPRVWLDRSAPAVAGLAECRVATLTVPAADGAWTLRLVGSFRMGHPDPAGRRSYTATLLSVRVTGPRRVPIPVDEYLRAEPDPWSSRAAVVLDHLEQAHGAELVRHVRGLGHDAHVVVPRALDPRGIDLTLLAHDGVGSLRLDLVGRAAESPDELAGRTGLALGCPCAG